MPVTLTRTDYRLDEIVTVGRLEFPAPAGYSVVVYDDWAGVQLRPVVRGQPDAVEDWRWGRFPSVDYGARATAVTLSFLVGASRELSFTDSEGFTFVANFYSPVAGVFPQRAQLVLSRAGFADVVATIESFADLRFNPDIEIAEARPAIEPDVGVRWAEPFDARQAFKPWPDLDSRAGRSGFVYCHPVLSGDGLEALLAGAGAATSDQSATLRDPDNLSRQPDFKDRARIFVQRLSDETSIVRNTDVDGADRSYSERRLELVGRVPVAQGMGVQLDGALFFVETAEPMGRTGFHRATVVRRFFQETI